jgi:hypothetical protein
VRECIWSWAKALYEIASASGENGTAVQLVEQDALSDERISNVPDFGTMLGERYGDRTAENRQGAPGATAGRKESQEPGAAREATAGARDTRGLEAALRPALLKSTARLDRLRRERLRAAKAEPRYSRAPQTTRPPSRRGSGIPRSSMAPRAQEILPGGGWSRGWLPAALAARGEVAPPERLGAAPDGLVLLAEPPVLLVEGSRRRGRGTAGVADVWAFRREGPYIGAWAAFDSEQVKSATSVCESQEQRSPRCAYEERVYLTSFATRRDVAIGVCRVYMFKEAFGKVATVREQTCDRYGRTVGRVYVGWARRERQIGSRRVRVGLPKIRNGP